MGFTSTTTSTAQVGYSVECWILHLETPGSIPAWGELYIATFPLFPVTVCLPEHVHEGRHHLLLHDAGMAAEGIKRPKVII